MLLNKLTPHLLLLGGSNRLFELFSCLLDPKRRCFKPITIAFQRFFLCESDNFRLITLLKKRLQFSF